MKKYIVEAWIMDKDQSEGRKQHDMIYEEFCPEVEAETPEEAVDYAVDWYADQARDNGYNVETDDDEIRIYEGGELTEIRYNFRIKEIPKDFLKFFRKKANLTQEELSKKTGISIRTIQAYESGARSLENANYKTLKTIADVIGCSPAELTITEKIEIE